VVHLGNEEFCKNPGRFVSGKRVGLVVNQTSFTSEMTSLPDFCEASREVDLRAIFAPEHGLFGTAQDMEAVGEGRRDSGVPVFSLYGENEDSLSPRPESMDLVDALVFDIQDVGSRYYTFVWTMALCMRACAEAGKEMIVLDRPNPLSGNVVSGPVQKDGFLSFVGLYPVCVRHGMTVGEMAKMLAGHFGIGCKLTVVPMTGWRRDMWFDQTGLPWIPPSPNMPTLQTATVYPGACLIEGTTLSEGRGTATPFEIVGAPGIDGPALAERMTRLHLPGCRFRPESFKPGFQKHAGKVCGGVHVLVTRRDAFDSFRTFVHLIAAVRDLFPEFFGWRGETYEFVSGVPAVDLLFGSPELRVGLEKGASVDDVLSGCGADAARFSKIREAFLLY